MSQSSPDNPFTDGAYTHQKVLIIRRLPG
jgi:hypothetical protein